MDQVPLTSPPPSPSATSHHRWYYGLGALGLLAVAGVLIFLAVRHPSSTTNTKKNGTVVAATPKYFTDIVGTVKSASTDSVTVNVPSQDVSGKVTNHDYHVTVSAQTSMGTVNEQTGQATTEATTLAAFTPGTAVQAFGDGQTNLASTFSFTATRLLRLAH